jgi:hypothetical protein
MHSVYVPADSPSHESTARMRLKSPFTPAVGYYYYCGQIILRIEFHTLAGIETTGPPVYQASFSTSTPPRNVQFTLQ